MEKQSEMQFVPIEKIKPSPNNPRVIRDEKFKKLVKSIEEFPDMLNKRPLIVFTDKDQNFVVLGGNMRLKALKELKYKSVPVILADDWTEEQKAEFLIKDNLGFGEWNWNELNESWDSELLEEWGLDLPNYMKEETDLEDFFEEEPKSETKSKSKIILEYSEEDYNEVIKMLDSIGGSKEQIIFDLIKEKTETK